MPGKWNTISNIFLAEGNASHLWRGVELKHTIKQDGVRVPDTWVEQSDTGTVLQIEAANETEHSGQYRCRFQNVAGVAEEVIELQVVVN